MPKILKRRSKPETNSYVLRPASELIVDPAEIVVPLVEEPEAVPAEPQPEQISREEEELRFAQIQAQAILDDARRDAEAYRAQARKEFEEELAALREQARQEGYEAGYAEGMDQAAREGKAERKKLAAEQIRAVEQFLSRAARERDKMLDDTREEIKDLAVAIAEKVIRVSLKNSSDILLRMVDAATDTHKRCEWAHIYVADCDLRGKVYTTPELVSVLGHVSSRIRIIPMADDESGTCIVELPDVILDASVSTQMENIKEVLAGVSPDKD